MLNGQFEAAVASLERARDLAGANSPVLLHLAEAYATGLPSKILGR